MIREQTLQHLARLLGPSEKCESHNRWIIAQPHHHPIHVVLNGGAENRAHVMIFNPAPPDGEHVVDLHITRIEEAGDLVERLQRLTGRAVSHLHAAVESADGGGRPHFPDR